MRKVVIIVSAVLLVLLFIPSTSLSGIIRSQAYAFEKSIGDDCAKSGIYGRVLDAGIPADGQGLILYQFDQTGGTSIASTTTDNSGCYSFGNAKSLAPNLKYRVVYSGIGPVPKIGWWFGPIIDAFSAGQDVHGGDIDIAPLPLREPIDGLVLQLPAAFTWEKRPAAGDTYSVEFSDLISDDTWETANLGSVDEFTLEKPMAGMESGKQYSWRVVVYQQPDSYGYSSPSRYFSFNTQAVPYLYPLYGNGRTKQLSISWQSMSWAEQYQLDEKRDDGSWIGVYKGGNNYFSQSGLKDGRYCYRVAASNSQSVSGSSNVRCSIVEGGAPLTHQIALPIISGD